MKVTKSVTKSTILGRFKKDGTRWEIDQWSFKGEMAKLEIDQLDDFATLEDLVKAVIVNGRIAMSLKASRRSGLTLF